MVWKNTINHLLASCVPTIQIVMKWPSADMLPTYVGTTVGPSDQMIIPSSLDFWKSLIFKPILKIKYYYWILTWQKCTLSHCSSVLNTIWIHLLTFWFTHSALLYLLTGNHMLPFATFPFISMVLAATRGRGGLQYELWQWRYMYPFNHSCISFRCSSPRNASYNWCLVEFQNQIG